MRMTRLRYVTLPAVVAAAMAVAAPASAQLVGPGAGNPGPNVGNFGTCVALRIAEGVHPSTFASTGEPGVFLQRGPDVFQPNEGEACSVGFLPPPPGVGIGG